MFNKPRNIVLMVAIFGLVVFILLHLLTKHLLLQQKLPKSEELNELINEQVNENVEPLQKPTVQKSIVKLDPLPVIPKDAEVRHLSECGIHDNSMSGRSAQDVAP